MYFVQVWTNPPKNAFNSSKHSTGRTVSACLSRGVIRCLRRVSNELRRLPGRIMVYSRSAHLLGAGLLHSLEVATFQKEALYKTQTLFGSVLPFARPCFCQHNWPRFFWQLTENLGVSAQRVHILLILLGKPTIPGAAHLRPPGPEPVTETLFRWPV
jgi:hypothetical protein